MSNLYAIGDIHGCLISFETILNNVPFNQGDTIVFMGDYIDRGPFSKEVIDSILSLKSDYHIVPLLGNHELMMLQARDNNENLRFWLRCGGVQTLNSFKAGDIGSWMKDIEPQYWDFLEGTYLFYETRDFIFAHGCIDPELPMKEQDPNVILWDVVDENIKHSSGKTFIAGHTAQTNGKVRVFDNTILIDSFSFGENGWLTCLDCHHKIAYQANEQGEFRKETL